MKKSDHNRLIYGLNSGEIQSTIPRLEIPLLDNATRTSVFIEYDGGFWWLDRSVQFIEDEPEPETWYHPVKERSVVGNTSELVGLKVFYANDRTFLCQVIEDFMLGTLEIRGWTRPDKNRMRMAYNRFIKTGFWEGLGIGKNVFWQVEGERFENIMIEEATRRLAPSI